MKKDSKTPAEPTGRNPETAELIAKGHANISKPSLQPGFTEDKRATVRHEHTNHFTNRAGQGNK